MSCSIGWPQRVIISMVAFSASWTTPVRAASLVPVADFDSAGLPSDVSMYAYVPDAVVSNPPLVVLIHYCGGTAPAVFGQAQGGGLVAAADEHGFIIIAPSSGRCWDIVSDQTRARDGGGDSHAIRRMVAHAIDAYGANVERVYATGDSSGGMMTQLLLGLYPDVFKGGSAMAGMPAGCRGDGESGNGGGYSGACAGGNVDRTPEEWGAIVESLNPGYEGLRPRVQLFHGDADDIIRFKNHTEAIEQWRYVLDLSPAADESLTDVPLGNHTAIRETWLGPCGLPVLDAFTSLGGDHGPSDALFPAQYLVPFLGLDQEGAVDPHVEACAAVNPGSGGADGAGGSDAAGGAESSGGSGGLTGGSGGTSGVGGTSTGGALASGGTSNPGDGGTAPDLGTGGVATGPESTPSARTSSSPNSCGWAASGTRPIYEWMSLLFLSAVALKRRRRGLG